MGEGLTRREAIGLGTAAAADLAFPSTADAQTAYEAEGFNSPEEQAAFVAFTNEFQKSSYYGEMWDILRGEKTRGSRTFAVPPSELSDLLEKHPVVKKAQVTFMVTVNRLSGRIAMEFVFIAPDNKVRTLRKTTAGTE